MELRHRHESGWLAGRVKLAPNVFCTLPQLKNLEAQLGFVVISVPTIWHISNSYCAYRTSGESNFGAVYGISYDGEAASSSLTRLGALFFLLLFPLTIGWFSISKRSPVPDAHHTSGMRESARPCHGKLTD